MTILYTQTFIEHSLIAYIIIVILSTICVGTFSYILFREYKWWKWWASAAFGAVFAVILCLIPTITNIVFDKEVTQMEVTLEDMTAKEFFSKYELIEQKGEIYVIQEKDE